MGRAPLIGAFGGVDNEITDADDAFLEIVGIDRATFEQGRRDGRPLSPPDSVELDLAALRLAASTGTASPYRKEFWHADGTRVPVLVSIWTSEGAPGQWLGSAVDLRASPEDPSHLVPPATERVLQPSRHTERLVGELVLERHRIVSMLDSTGALVWSIDRELRLAGSNLAFQRAQRTRTGRTILVGDAVLDPSYQSDRHARWAEWYGRVLEGQQFDALLEDDHGHVVDLRFSPITGSDGEVTGATIVGTDITAENIATTALVRRENLLRIAGRLGRVAAWTLDGHTRRVTLSDEMVTLLDLPQVTDVAFDDSVDFYPHEHRDRIRDLVERCLAHAEPFDIEISVRTPTERTMWIRVMGDADVDDAGDVVGIHGAVADLTERHLSQLKLREQAGLLDNATDAILVRDLDGHVTYWNHAAEQLYGWTASEALGGHISDLVDGGDMAKYEAMEEILWTDGEWSGRLDNVDRHGNRVVIELHVNVIRDLDGTPVAVFSIASDVTERVRLEERLALSQKLESVGQLTGGLAHDFNNLLTVILGGSELITEAVTDRPEVASLARMVTSAAERGAELTARLLAFARRQPLQPQVVDPVAVTNDMLALLERSFPESIAIAVEADDDGCQVAIDPGQLEAALMNLALNARDAMVDGGRLTITIGNAELLGEPALGIAAGRYVRVAVSDTGTGIPDEIRERVFDPFFSTKETGKGSGLGLSMVYGFIRQSGGHVELHSEPGVGTTVELLLPRAAPDQSAVERSSEPRSIEDLPRGSERVLVVEDEPLVRRQTVSVLRSLGYDVVEAEHAAAARVVLELGVGCDSSRAPGDAPVDLVFSDVVMPGGTSGLELAVEVRRQFPALPILLTSGYTADAERQGYEEFPLLNKPYRRSTLAHTLRRILDQTGSSHTGSPHTGSPHDARR